jgi:hypothetical protein
MTPLSGLVLALIAGWIVRDARRSAALIVIPYLAVVAAQTWGIASGRGVSPPSTVWPIGPALSYYVVQAIILVLSLGVALLLGAVRARQTQSPTGAATAGRRTAIAAAIAGTGTAVFIAIALLDSSPVAHHSTEGAPPVQGLLGIGLSVVGIVVLSVMLLIGRRSATRASHAATTEKGTTMMTGRASSYVAAIAAIGAAAALAMTAGLSPARAAASAAAATPAASGVVHIYEAGTSTHSNRDVITGFFTDYGVDHLDALDHGNVNKIVLTKGSFEANVRKLHARIKVVSDNPRSCALVLKSTAPVTLSHGTGSYRGIHGTLTVTVVNAVVFPKKDGRCAEDISKPVRANVTSVTGSGRVSL